MAWWGFRPYEPVGARRARAILKMARLTKKGPRAEPVAIVGRQITRTFWGNAWCRNLEAYSDFANRLPRGRTYVRNGSVMDLKITPGAILAKVCGSDLYDVKIAIAALPPPRWRQAQARCSGQIGSLVELLEGHLSDHVMRVVTDPREGLFPAPREIKMSCSCPDWAGMCKHLAAVLYGIGNRLDQEPELLFALRQVDLLELVAAAALPAVGKRKAAGKIKSKTIAAASVADVFGIELDPGTAMAPPRPAAKAKARAASKTARKVSARAKPRVPARTRASRRKRRVMTDMVE